MTLNSQELLGCLKLAMASYTYPATANADPDGLSESLSLIQWLEPVPGLDCVWAANQHLRVPRSCTYHTGFSYGHRI